VIRFSAFLVVVAFGLLVAGVHANKLLLVYLAIGVSGVALLSLGIGAAVKWREFFGTSRAAAPDVPVADPVPAQAPEVPVQASKPVPAGASAAQARSGSVWESAVPPTGMFPAVKPVPSADPAPGPSAAEPSDPGSARSAAPTDVPQAPAAFTRPSPEASPPAPAVWQWSADSLQASAAPAQASGPAVASEPPSAADKPAVVDRAVVIDEPTAIDLPTVADRRTGAGQPPARDARTRPDLKVPPASTDTSPPPAGPEPAPADASPADASPADASPADASPADASPADASPADAEPAPAADAAPSDASLPTAGPEPASEAAASEAPAPEAPAPADLGAASVGEAAPVPPEAESDSAPDPQTIVTVVPGVPRYHNATCILIRFMGEGDLDKMTIAAAQDVGCTPCRACLPDQPHGSAELEVTVHDDPGGAAGTGQKAHFASAVSCGCDPCPPLGL